MARFLSTIAKLNDKGSFSLSLSTFIHVAIITKAARYVDASRVAPRDFGAFVTLMLYINRKENEYNISKNR